MDTRAATPAPQNAINWQKSPSHTSWLVVSATARGVNWLADLTSKVTSSRMHVLSRLCCSSALHRQSYAELHLVVFTASLFAFQHSFLRLLTSDHHSLSMLGPFILTASLIWLYMVVYQPPASRFTQRVTRCFTVGSGNINKFCASFEYGDPAIGNDIYARQIVDDCIEDCFAQSKTCDQVWVNRRRFRSSTLQPLCMPSFDRVDGEPHVVRVPSVHPLYNTTFIGPMPARPQYTRAAITRT